jgi:uncharacterized membrane protein
MTPEIELLVKEIAALRARVEALEGAQSRPPMRPAAPAPAPRVLSTPPAPSKPQVPSEPSLTPGQLLGFVAVICFVLAASYLIKLAIDSGWLTPARQLGLSSLLGGALIAAGLAWSDKDRSYFSLLPGAGIVILFMSAYGGNLYYGLYGPWEAAMASAAVALGSLVLYRLLRQDFYVIVAVVGTYLSPILLPAIRGGLFDSMVFFAIWDATFAALAIALESRLMLLLASYLALGVFAATTPAAGAGDSSLWLAVGFQLLQFNVMAFGTLAYSIRLKSPLTLEEAAAFFPLLLFFYGIEYHWLNQLVHDWTPWIALGFAALVYALYAAAKDYLGESSLRSGAIVHTFVAFVLFHAVYLELLPEHYAPWLALGVLFLLWSSSHRLETRGKHAAYVVAAGFLLVIEYSRIMLSGSIPVGELTALNLLYAGAFALAYLALSGSEKGIGKDDLGFMVLLAGNAQALVGLQRLTHEHLPSSLSAGGPFVTTVLWALLGVGQLLWAGSRKDPALSRSALVVLGLAAFKGLVFDVAEQQPVLRIVCLLALGAALYFSGFVLRKTSELPQK